LQKVTETSVPRADVRAGGLDDRDFAAQLDKVVQGDAAYETYTDAELFFSLTYPTSGLKELIEAVFGHLTGRGGSAILRAQTSFGGGKTHSLIALYHLAGGFRPEDLHEFVDDGVLPDVPVRVAAIVGPLSALRGGLSADLAVPAFSGAHGLDRQRFELMGEGA
jgi:predicted AAA+ superfamily ATPase